MSLTGTRLDPILANVRERSAVRRKQQGLEQLRRETFPDPARRARFTAGLGRPKMGFIAECKRASPSAGAISTEVDLLTRAEAYAAGGADAVSVLTEQDHFQGAPGDLERVQSAGLPRLRKDFILDEGMVLESLAMGADAILLMAICLPGGQLAELRALAGELGLAVLAEAHDEAELDRCLEIQPDLLGVNARDLRTFAVDVAHVERMLPRIPSPDAGGPLRVAESGILGIEEVLRVRAAGADAALVGEALMRSGDPAATLRQWKGALDAQ